jgi:hypothetical protein
METDISQAVSGHSRLTITHVPHVAPQQTALSSNNKVKI